MSSRGAETQPALPVTEADMRHVREFKFRQHDTVGAADADDDRFLIDCFVDTGDLGILLDCREARSILVGRTGGGKSALLKVLLSLE